MRLLLALLLVAAPLAGCIDPATEAVEPIRRLAAADIEVPEGATLAAVPGGYALEFLGVDLPFRTTFTLPEHATMVRAVSEDARVFLANDDTGRRRCNAPTVESFSTAHQRPYSCSSVAALDRPGATWRLVAAGVGGALDGDVRVEFLDVPLDGLAGLVDLANLSKPDLELQPTQVLRVPSFDGTLLRVELTLPVGDGPWPVILESSPYHDDGVRSEPASWQYFVQDWAKRGYAIAVADVRGFGDSGGCVEVWGPNEQADQKALVEWAAQQEWSNGRIGFYGQSYVGTTPVEAAVQAPEALKAIIAVAPVINAYDDWHFGGVPNGENLLSPVAYQAQTDAIASDPALALGDRFTSDPALLANNIGNGPCDPTTTVRPNDPRALYDAFYVERDFSLRAGDVTAAVLYTQGFEDANVKSAMIPGWFNEITAPKLGVFGHWLHQHPSRLDTELLMVAWMDHYVKGLDLGLDRLPAAVITADRENERLADAWPPQQPTSMRLYPDFAGAALAPAPAPGSDQVVLDAAGIGMSPLGKTMITLEVPVERSFSLAGTGVLHVTGTLEGAMNGYLGAALYEVGEERTDLVATGQFNLAHDATHTTYTPVTSAAAVTFDLPFRPTEHIFRSGNTLRLEVYGVPALDATDVGGALGARFTVEGGEATYLELPGVDLAEYRPIPLTARP